MPEYQRLTEEAFRALAREAGFDPNDAHLRALWPEVETLFGVLAKLRGLPYAQPDMAILPPEERPSK